MITMRKSLKLKGQRVMIGIIIKENVYMYGRPLNLILFMYFQAWLEQ